LVSPTPKPRVPPGYLFHPEPTAVVDFEPATAAAAAPQVHAMSAPAETVGGWVKHLIQSPAYQAQRQMIRKFAPEDQVVATVLDALLAQDGSMTPAALARRIGQPSARLDGLIAKVQRLLNVD